MKKMDREILHASRQGDIEKVSFSLRNGANINARGKDRETPIIKAIKYNKNEIVFMLLKRGANTKVKDIAGRTLKLIAMESGNIEAAKLLSTK